jgi:hypothetical protein
LVLVRSILPDTLPAKIRSTTHLREEIVNSDHVFCMIPVGQAVSCRLRQCYAAETGHATRPSQRLSEAEKSGTPVSRVEMEGATRLKVKTMK